MTIVEYHATINSNIPPVAPYQVVIIIINTSVVQNCVFYNACQGDPQKALLKAASIRANIEYGA